MRRDVVPHEGEDRHHDVLGDADRVAVRDLGDGHAAVDRRLEVDVIRADPGGHRQLQVRRLREALRSQIRRPERLRDDHVRVLELAFESRVGPVLVGRDDELVPALLEELPQPELARDAAEQLARREVDRLRRGRGLPAVVALDRRDAVARVGRRVPANRVVVQDAQDLHDPSFTDPSSSRVQCGF